MCPLVALHDRAEPVVVHLDRDQFPAGRAVMRSRKMRTTAVLCWTVEKSVFTSRSRPSGTRVPLARAGPRRVLEQELKRYLVPEALPCVPTPQRGRLCPPATMTVRL